MAHDVFISYSTKDKPIADAVCGTLERNGVRCWIAPRDITPGTDWGEAIIEAIGATQLMVLVFSGHANDSPQVKREVQRAFERGITVIPLRLQDVAPNKSLEYYIAPLHWLDAITQPMEQHLRKLTETVQRLLAKNRRPGDDSGPGQVVTAAPVAPAPSPPPPRPPAAPVAPPPQQAWQPQPPRPPQQTFTPPHSQGPIPVGYAAAKAGASGRAIAALILGIVSCLACVFPFLGLPAGAVAFALGLVENGAIKAGRAPREGATLARIGLIAGAVGAGLSVVILIMIAARVASEHSY